MKRLFSSWQGLLAGLAALGVYLCLPPLIRLYDPTAGTFDGGYLQWVGLATVLCMWTVFIGWCAFQIAFPSVDREADASITQWFDALTDREKWYVTQAAFVLMMVLFVECLRMIPLT